MGPIHELGIIVDTPVACRVLQQSAKNGLSKIKFSMVSDDEIDTPGVRPRFYHVNGLRMTLFRNKKCIAVRPAKAVAHAHSLGRCGSFIQKRRVRHLQSRQIGNHRLEIQQSFQSTLRNFSLVRSVMSIPSGILEDIPLNYERRNAVVIAHAYERAESFVF